MTPANREAIVEGRKTMTRRRSGLEEINESPNDWRWHTLNGTTQRAEMLHKNGTIVDVFPPFRRSQRLYIKEPHYRYGKWVKNGLTKKTGKQARRFVATRKSAIMFSDKPPRFVQASTNRHLQGWYKRSSLFMPKEFARTWLLVTDVKAPERGKDISEPDAVAEGINAEGCCRCPDEIAEGVRFCIHCNLSLHDLVSEFEILLKSIYGADAMEKWYWPIEFEKIKKE